MHLSTLKLVGLMMEPIGWTGWRFVVGGLGPIFGDPKWILFQLPNGGKLRVSLRDTYWTKLLLRNFAYEPEVSHVLGNVLSPQTAFIDCGANIGYWSISAQPLIGRPEQIVAVELAPATYQRLRENLDLNGLKIVALNRAVYSQSGLSVPIDFHESIHAAAHIQAGEVSGDTAGSGNVLHSMTITLDEILESYFPSWEGPVVVKLDVEGAEIDAFKGAGNLLGRDTLVIYEDHGADRECEISRYVLESLDLEVFFCSPAGEITQIKSVDQVARTKPNPRCGYNYLACSKSSSFFTLFQAELR